MGIVSGVADKSGSLRRSLSADRDLDPHSPSFDCLTFDGEIGYGLLVSGAMHEHWAKYG